MKGLEIIGKEKTLAIVVRSDTQKDSLNFLTPPEFPLQVGIHNKTKGDIVNPHKHIPLKNVGNIQCQEIFYIENGKMEVNIFGNDDKLFKTVILNKGDLIILNSGHGVKFLEKTRMIEIKQGPYRGKEDEKKYI